MSAQGQVPRRDGQAVASFSRRSPSPAVITDNNAVEAMQGNAQQRTTLAALRYTRSERAWTCLSMGCFDEACECSARENDIVAWAAALSLTDNAKKAQVALEAYVIATSAMLYEVLCSRTTSAQSSWPTSPLQDTQGPTTMPRNDQALYRLMQRRDRVVAEWFAHRLAATSSSTSNDNNNYREHDMGVGCSTQGTAMTAEVRGEVPPAMQKAVLRHMLQLTDWRSVHRWYIIALYLGGEDAAEYRAPQSRWFRNFMGLPDTFTNDDNDKSAASESDTSASSDDDDDDEGSARRWNALHDIKNDNSTAARRMDLRKTVTWLLASCAEVDVHFISAVTAYKACRYRTCMIAASRVLEGAELMAADTGNKDTNKSVAEAVELCTCTTSRGVHAATTPLSTNKATPQSTWRLLETEANFMRFMRCMAGLELGERMQAATDIVALMSQSTNDIVFAVGSGMAVFGLGAVVDATPVLQHITERWLRRYVVALCEYIHALTLTQLGNMGAALSVAQCAAPYAPRHDVGEQLSHLIVRLGVALEDADVLLATALSPERLLYIALSPAFFGGLTPAGIRLKPTSLAAALLSPSHVPLYMSTRQALPYYMHRAAQLSHQGRHMKAWRVMQNAVAVADEVVGSLEFAFTDCFPLRVYAAGCHAGRRYVEALLQDEITAAKRCLDDPHNVIAASEKATIFSRNDRRVLAVLQRCRRWAWQMRRFYPYAQLAESTRTLVAIMACEEQVLRRAIVLARRYPSHVAPQGLLMNALHSQLYIPEAVDAAERIGQNFPHAAEVAAGVARLLPHEKGASYTFDYRTLVPIRYVSGRQQPLFTKRMLIVVVFLIVHVIIVLVTVGVNMTSATRLPASLRPLAVRMQLPSVAPLYFAALCVVHAVVAVVTPRNLIHTLLQDNFFCDTAINRLLFCLRGVALVNAFNAMQISIAGNNFLLGVAGTGGLYAVLTVLFMPFTSRVWFLPSVDEPDIEVYPWLTLLAVDVVTSLIVILPHILLAALEPLMSIVFYLFLPTTRPDRNHASTSVRRRLLYHKNHRDAMPARFSVGSGSRFVHIRCMRLLYYRTHSDMATKHRVEAELEEENYRVFPIIEPALVCDIAMQPLYTEEEIQRLMDLATSPTTSSRSNEPATVKEAPQAYNKECGDDGVTNATGVEREVHTTSPPSPPRRTRKDGSISTSTHPSTQSTTHTNTKGATSASHSPSLRNSLVCGGNNKEVHENANDETCEIASTAADPCHTKPPRVNMIDALRREVANMPHDTALPRTASFFTTEEDKDDAVIVAKNDSPKYGNGRRNSLLDSSAAIVNATGGEARRPQSEIDSPQANQCQSDAYVWPYNNSNELYATDYIDLGVELGEMATANPYTSPALEESAQRTTSSPGASANTQRPNGSQSDPALSSADNVFDFSIAF